MNYNKKKKLARMLKELLMKDQSGYWGWDEAQDALHKFGFEFFQIDQQNSTQKTQEIKTGEEAGKVYVKLMSQGGPLWKPEGKQLWACMSKNIAFKALILDGFFMDST